MPAAAQTAVASPRLDNVVVTATRTPTRIDQAIADVTVIDRAAIERADGRTLAELLGQQPGIQATSNGGFGKSSSVFIRGLESRHTLLLIDGVRYGSATLGTPSWENLPLEEIDRIEIVRGPLSGLYGSDAVGGVIQIFTRRGMQGFAPNARVTIGSDNYRKYAAGVRMGQGPLDAAIQLQRTRVDGFSATNPHAQFGNYDPDRDGFEQDAGSGRIGLAIDGGWRADVRFLRSEGETRLDDGPGTDALAKLRSKVMSVEAGGPVTGRWRTLFRIGRSSDEYATVRSASAFTDLGTTGTVQDQLSWENTVDTPVGTLLLVGERLDQKTTRPAAAFSVSERRINGVAVGLTGRAGAHSWQGNLRTDRNSQFGHKNTGSLGYGYDIASQWRIAASGGTSFVMPSFNQLYFPGFGNPNLQPESGKHAEASLRWTGESQSAHATYFSNRIRGYISSGPAPTNIPRTRIDGVSLDYEARFSFLTMNLAADHVNPRNTTQGSSYDKQLPRRAKYSFKAGADATFGAFSAGGGFVVFDHRFDNAANTTRVGGYAVLDLRADWRFRPDMALGLRLNNVGDKTYETVYGYNQPGRQVYVTLRYDQGK